MRLWWFITKPHNWKVCEEHGVFGFNWRYYVTWRDYLKAGDRAVVYLIGPRQELAARATIETDGYEDFTDIGWREKAPRRRSVHEQLEPDETNSARLRGQSWLLPYRVRLKIEPAPRPCRIHYSTEPEPDGEKANVTSPGAIDELTFIADKGDSWNVYVQPTLVRLTDEDYHRACDLMGFARAPTDGEAGAGANLNLARPRRG